jgi:hypothetical protein
MQKEKKPNTDKRGNEEERRVDKIYKGIELEKNIFLNGNREERE